MLHAPEVTGSDLHFGKVSLSREGDWIAGCRLVVWPKKMVRLRGGHREGKTRLRQAIWKLKAQSETLDQAAKKLRAPSKLRAWMGVLA